MAQDNQSETLKKQEIFSKDQNNSKQAITEKETFVKIQSKKKLRRRIILALSFIIFVLIPSGVLIFYYIFQASDRYASKAGFSVRTVDNSPSLDGLAALGLPSASSTTADSNIILSYLYSRPFIERLDTKLNIIKKFSNTNIDYLSRFDNDKTIEDFIKYWKSRIHISFDNSSGIIEVNAQAFSPETAQKISQEAILAAKELINKLSEDERNDALKFAKNEVSIQESRLLTASNAIRIFRAKEKNIDPSISSKLDMEATFNLQNELSSLEAQLTDKKAILEETSPIILSLIRKINTKKNQLLEYYQKIYTSNKQSTTPQILEKYNNLLIEEEFAKQAYSAALQSLERARITVNRQQRYLAIHLHPQIPQKAEYPKRITNIFVGIFLSIVIWGIGVLIAYSIRDHLT